MAEGAADRAIRRGCATDHRSLRNNTKRQGLIARTSAIRRADGDRCVARRTRRAADQAARRIQRQPGWQGSCDRIGNRTVAGCDLMAEGAADRAIRRGCTTDHRRLGEDCYFQGTASSSMTVRC